MCTDGLAVAPRLASSTDFAADLVASGLLVETGVPGVFGKNGTFEAIVRGLDQLVDRSARDLRPEVFRFPPVVPRRLIERSQYLAGFPQLIGAVHSFEGSDGEHARLLEAVERGGPWGALLSATDVVLTPAACYPVYAMLSGALPAGGRTIDVASYCFRHEPSADPARMQIFRMHEVVRLADAQSCVSFRDEWLERGLALLASVGLEARCVAAIDPFFGRRGRLLAATQREQNLKFELVVPIGSAERPTAVASANWHQDHFGELFEIVQADGTRAHTACVGFGLERITLALLRAHGTDVSSWPVAVRTALRLDA
jgi:seryl-tRNA synthetase